CWYLEDYGFGLVGGAHTAEVILALSPDNGNLPSIAAWDAWGIFEDTPAASRGSRNFAAAIKIPEGSYVRALATGGTLAAADVVTVTFQLAVHQLNPSFLMSEEDRRQVLAAHERTGAPLAETATAQRRAV